MDAIVIGAGIAGLSAAIALRAVGIDVRVYERAPVTREVGAGISLWANALRALDHLGAGDTVRSRSQRMTASQIRVRDGHTIAMHLQAAGIETSLRLPELVRIIHRADLLSALVSHVPGSILHYGRECVAVETGVRPGVRFLDGATDAADLVIGADGIRSVVRSAILGVIEPRYAGYTCWRGITERPADIAPGYIGEWWGRGQRLGIATLPDDRVYWFAVQNAAPGQHAADERAHLLSAFATWAQPGPQLLETTDRARIIRNDIVDRPPVAVWSKGAVGVIGDAAHPTTPNLGQGGCMAIEDSVVLAQHLAAAPPAEALKRFAAARAGRTSEIVRESWRFGRLAHLEGRLTVAARDFAIAALARFTSPSMVTRYATFDVGPLPRQIAAATKS
jgi:2-polyprenyl-6-methoxyphenol hydroxylase-like FAD-dependent oxidoreductase